MKNLPREQSTNAKLLNHNNNCHIDQQNLMPDTALALNKGCFNAATRASLIQHRLYKLTIIILPKSATTVELNKT